MQIISTYRETPTETLRLVIEWNTRAARFARRDRRFEDADRHEDNIDALTAEMARRDHEELARRIAA